MPISESRLAAGGAMLVGRGPELGVIADLVETARRGRGGCLVVRGEAGIGKSALLRAAAAQAAGQGSVVLVANGAPSERRLPFAGLHQLLRPLLADVEELADRQREALQVAFGAAGSAAPTLYGVGLAALELLGDASTRAPLLVLADDVQWLDRPTVDVLTFIGRRVRSDPVALLLTVRDERDDPLVGAALPELRLSALDEAAAGALLDAHAPDLPPPARQRLLLEAAGNPLALVELPAVFAAAVGPAGVVPTPIPLNARLEQTFAARRSELPPPTQAALLVAAADEAADVATVLSVASDLAGAPIDIDALHPAIDARLIDLRGTTLRFRHPLMRSATYQTAPLAQRLAVHAALAGALVREPDRRVWHRAAAVVGRDDDVAAELDQAASRAQRRGAVMVAVAALERAAELSTDTADRTGRLLSASELACELGRLDAALDMIGRAELDDLGPVERGRMLAVEEAIDPGDLHDTGRIRRLVSGAVDAGAAGDVDLAMRLLWIAASRCWWTGEPAEVRRTVEAAARQLGTAGDDPRLLAVLAYTGPLENGRDVLARLPHVAVGRGDGEALRFLGSAALVLGDFRTASTYLASADAAFRAQGRLGLLSRMLTVSGWARIFTGEWDAVRTGAAEVAALAAEAGEHSWQAGQGANQAMLAALRGDFEGAEALAEEVQAGSLRSGMRMLTATTQHARAMAALGAGRHDEAYEHLRRLFDPADPVYHDQRFWMIADLAEAAFHAGRSQEARAIVDQLEPLVAQATSPLHHLGIRHARAVLADDEDAEPLFEAALRADLTTWPLHHARLLLAYGSWLRRHRRPAESRAPLRVARDLFDSLGALPWSQRAREELRASGETSRRRTPAAREQLTPQELQIAQLAAKGLTNREIGQQLYLSHRTVGSHLYRSFPKLGITSRSQLWDAVRDVDS